MGFFPAFLDLSGKECLVVGGGAVALQKTRDLTAARARVTVVATRFRGEFRRMAGLRRLERAFRPGDIPAGLRRPWLVVAATDDEALHARIASLCRRRRVWVNVVDRPAFCDFIVPSVVRRGPVTVAVSTGGQSPALAKFVGGKVRAMLGPEIGRLGRLLAGLRPALRRLPMAERRELLSCFVSEGALSEIRRSGAAAVRRYKKMILKSVPRE
ncbi:MAG: bifunctional precorrin-2 dehydrogenase/sirohydrochlorin ferrochelatase [Elusimicrobia bacterium]|nr:bifunctional precorrin-2 dehydrogenase/sirohydrochlorin ferrochelatase [Elusimicrobiota bacterium]